jgi:hypothetical protein
MPYHSVSQMADLLRDEVDQYNEVIFANARILRVAPTPAL